MASCQNIGEIGQKQERKQKNRHQVSEPMRSKQTKVGENATGDNEAAWGNTKKENGRRKQQRTHQTTPCYNKTLGTSREHKRTTTGKVIDDM